MSINNIYKPSYKIFKTIKTNKEMDTAILSKVSSDSTVPSQAVMNEISITL